MNNSTAKAKPKMTVKNGVVYGDALSAQEKKRIVMQKKKDRKAKKVRKSAQQTIPYVEMCRDGICKVNSRLYTKSIAFEDINYQLAQNEDKTAIFENWCDFLNYFDSSIFVQLSFINQKKYFFDYKAISEPIAPATAERLKRGMKGGNKYGKPVPGQPQPQSINLPREHGEIKDSDINPLRNKRDVWKINTVPFKGGHYNDLPAYPTA